MLPVIPYDRAAAVAYAHKWAFRRNPKYYDFEEIPLIPSKLSLLLPPFLMILISCYRILLHSL